MVKQSTLKLIADFESFRGQSYQDIAGIWTIGYGTTRIYGHPVTQGMEVNRAVAYIFLLEQVKEYASDMDQEVSVPLNQNQFDALTSFVYNLGIVNFQRSTLLKRINSGLKIERRHFTDWNKARVDGILRPVAGLTMRRNKEYDLFMKETL